jgi:hypothetical protein
MKPPSTLVSLWPDFIKNPGLMFSAWCPGGVVEAASLWLDAPRPGHSARGIFTTFCRSKVSAMGSFPHRRDDGPPLGWTRPAGPSDPGGVPRPPPRPGSRSPRENERHDDATFSVFKGSGMGSFPRTGPMNGAGGNRAFGWAGLLRTRDHWFWVMSETNPRCAPFACVDLRSPGKTNPHALRRAPDPMKRAYGPSLSYLLHVA